MTSLREILAKKGSRVFTVEPNRTVLEAVWSMNEHKIGALVVTDNMGRLVGMFTERDILRRVVGESRKPQEVLVSEVMSTDVLWGSPDTGIDEASRIMKDSRIRHLPVCDRSGRLLGLISIGDVNAYHLSVQETAIQHLEEYICSAA